MGSVGWKSSSFLALIVSAILTVGAPLLDVVPKDSAASVVIGFLVLVAGFMVQRGFVTVTETKAKALVDAATNAATAPGKPAVNP